MKLGSACHYCGEQQPTRKLRRLELSSLGDVLVCRDVEPCQRRGRAQLFARTAAAVAAPTPPARRGRAVRTRRRSRERWAIWLAFLVIGVLLLPHLTIHGHHVRIWLFP